jgi:hypothetical protein
MFKVQNFKKFIFEKCLDFKNVQNLKMFKFLIIDFKNSNLKIVHILKKICFVEDTKPQQKREKPA